MANYIFIKDTTLTTLTGADLAPVAGHSRPTQLFKKGDVVAGVQTTDAIGNKILVATINGNAYLLTSDYTLPYSGILPLTNYATTPPSSATVTPYSPTGINKFLTRRGKVMFSGAAISAVAGYFIHKGGKKGALIGAAIGAVVFYFLGGIDIGLSDSAPDKNIFTSSEDASQTTAASTAVKTS